MYLFHRRVVRLLNPVGHLNLCHVRRAPKLGDIVARAVALLPRQVIHDLAKSFSGLGFRV